MYFVDKVKEKKMTDKNLWLEMLVMLLVFGMMVFGCDNGSIGGVNDFNGTTWSGTAVNFGPIIIVFDDTTFEMTYTNENFEPDEVFGFKGSYTYSKKTFTGICTSTKAGNNSNWIDSDIYNISPFNGIRLNNTLTLSKVETPWLNGTVLSKQ